MSERGQKAFLHRRLTDAITYYKNARETRIHLSSDRSIDMLKLLTELQEEIKKPQ